MCRSSSIRDPSITNFPVYNYHVSDSQRIDNLRRRIENDPASLAFALLAEEHRRLGDFEDAIRVARVGLVRHPDYLLARVTLGRALMQLERDDEAEGEFEFVVRSAPENLIAVRCLAEIHQRKENPPEAIQQPPAALDIGRQDLAAESWVTCQPVGPDTEPITSQPAEPTPEASFTSEPTEPVLEPQLTADEAGRFHTGLKEPVVDVDFDIGIEPFGPADEALDALTLNLPDFRTPLQSESAVMGSWELQDVSSKPEFGSGDSGFETRDSAFGRLNPPDAAALEELERWLGAIIEDRQSRLQREHR